ncbi:hypothetical protein BH23GEM6_BH23GEM6_04420 [soil metagenome]
MTDTAPLAALAARIVAEHQACEASARSALEHARNCGELLIEAKAKVPFGAWRGWLDENFPASERTAQLYVRIATRWPELAANTQRVADLSLRGAAVRLAKPSEPVPSLAASLRAALAEVARLEESFALARDGTRSRTWRRWLNAKLHADELADRTLDELAEALKIPASELRAWSPDTWDEFQALAVRRVAELEAEA